MINSQLIYVPIYIANDLEQQKNSKYPGDLLGNWFCMKVFKFGGASIRHADAIRKVGGILLRYEGEEIIVIVSAMGKTTNAT